MTRFIRWFQIVMAAGFLGTTFDAGTGCVSKVINNVNPCGTILNCDPLEYELTIQGARTDYNVDPTCTIAGACGSAPFPSSVGTVGTTTGTTGTTTTGTTTTGNGT